MRKFSPSELSGETRAAIRAFWRAALNGRANMRRLYVEAQSMVEAEWFNPELPQRGGSQRKELDMDSEDKREDRNDVVENATETKICNQCGEAKPLSEFRSRYGGRETKLCNTCRARHRRASKKRREEAESSPQPEPPGGDLRPTPEPAPPVAHQPPEGGTSLHRTAAHVNGTASLVKRLPAQLPTPSMVRLSFGQAEKLLNLVIGETRIDEEGVRIEATALARFLPALLDGLVPDPEGVEGPEDKYE